MRTGYRIDPRVIRYPTARLTLISSFETAEIEPLTFLPSLLRVTVSAAKSGDVAKSAIAVMAQV